MKKKSDLNPPLLRSQLKCFKNMVKLRRTILGLNIFLFSCKNLPFFGPDLTNNLDRNATFYLHPWLLGTYIDSVQSDDCDSHTQDFVIKEFHFKARKCRSSERDVFSIPEPSFGHSLSYVLLPLASQRKDKIEKYAYTVFSKGAFFSEGIAMIVKSPNRQTFYFPQLWILNVGHFIKNKSMYKRVGTI